MKKAIAAGAGLGYILGGAVLPYVLPRSISERERKGLERVEFRSPHTGPDRAFIAELPQQAFARRMELIRGAHCTLDISVYTIKPGITSKLLFAEILRAADRGVQVRILLSGKTNKLANYKDIFYALASHPGVTLRVYNPLRPHTPWKWQVMMHDKIMIADGRVLSLGGRNFGDEYCNPPGYPGRITLDREVFVLHTGGEGSVLPSVRVYFGKLWHHKDTRAVKAGGTANATGPAHRRELLRVLDVWKRHKPEYFITEAPLQRVALPTNRITLVHNPLNTGPKAPWVGHQMLRLAREGKNVWVQTPYMTHNPYTLRALSETRAGVLTNSAYSTPNLPAFSLYLANRARFISTGAHLWEFQSGRVSIHGKSFLLDDGLCAVGSFNLDDRSMYIDTETMLVVHGKEFRDALAGHMHALRTVATPVGPDNRYLPGYRAPKVPKRKLRVLKGAARVFGPLRFLV